MNTPRQLLLLVGLLGLTVRAQEGAAPGWIENLHLTASGTASWVNNHSRTSHEPTRKDAATYELNLSGGKPRQLAPSWLLIGSGEISALQVPEYDLADNVRAGGRLTLQRKFGLGPLAPVLQFTAGATFKSARLDADEGWTTEAGVQLARRVLPNLRLTLAAGWLEHSARRDTFDLVQHSYSLDSSWDINERWTLSGSISRLEGDIVANAAWSIWAQAIYAGSFGPVVRNYYRSRPWVVTDVYGPGWVSYNVEAEVDLWSVSLAYAVSDHTALELRHGGAYVVNWIGIAYPTDSWSLSLNHRF